MTETTRPQRIVMASDPSAGCDRALARAALLARAWHSELTVVHVVQAADVAAHERLSSGAPSWCRPPCGGRHRRLHARHAGPAAGRALVRGRSADTLSRLHVALHRVLEPGAPETLLADHVASVDVDLVAPGSQGRSGLARALIGSTVENLLHTLDCDTLVVRGGRTRLSQRHDARSRPYLENP